MTCEECREKLVESCEGSLDAGGEDLVAAHLEGCEACQREAKMVRAMHERLVQAGRARGEAGVTQRVMEQVAEVDQHATGQWGWWKRVARPSAMAAAVAVIAGVALMLVVWGQSARVAYADVLGQVNKAKAVRFQMLVLTDGGAKATDAEVLIVQPGWMIIRTPGVKMVMNLEKGTMLTLMEQDRRAMVTDMKGGPPVGEGNLMDLFKKTEGKASKDLESQEVEGKKCRGFEVRDGGMVMTVWADEKTELPALVELAGVGSGGKSSRTIFSKIEWNPMVDERELSVEVPAGYQLIKLPTSATAPATKG